MWPPLCRTNPVGHREAEAGAALERLGREEGLEDPGLRVRIHAAPVSLTVITAYAPGATSSPLQLFVGSCTSTFRVAIGETAALRHRITRIDDEIHDDLLQLRDIDPDRPHSGSMTLVNSSDSSRSLRSIVSMLLDDAVEVDDLHLEQLLAAESQKLSRQGGGAPCGRPNLASGPPRHSPRQATMFRVADDHREQVVEIMGHTAGEPADGSPSSVIAGAGFETLPLRDIPPDEQMAVGNHAGVEAEFHRAFPSAGRRDELSFVLAEDPACGPRRSDLVGRAGVRKLSSGEEGRWSRVTFEQGTRRPDWRSRRAADRRPGGASSAHIEHSLELAVALTKDRFGLEPHGLCS